MRLLLLLQFLPPPVATAAVAWGADELTRKRVGSLFKWLFSDASGSDGGGGGVAPRSVVLFKSAFVGYFFLKLLMLFCI